MDETLLYQLETDLQTLFNGTSGYTDVTVKKSYDGDIDVSYPLVVIQELENSDNARYYDLEEHVINVSYQFTILAEQTVSHDAEYNVTYIMELIKNYMRGAKYHSLERMGSSPITTHPNDKNIKIGYMRYRGCIDIDNNIIYRRS